MTPIDRTYRVVTHRDDPGLVGAAQKRIGAEWPEFMLHDPVADGLVDCYARLPDFQFVLIDASTEEVVSIGNSIPICFDGDLNELPDDGWDWAMTQGLDDLARGRQPGLLCALQVVVFGNNRGRGVSRHTVRAMKEIGRAAGLASMIAPVRPSQKCDYPLVPIDRYIRWTTDDGELPFDAWLRVHARLRARLIRPCRSAMRIEGTVAEWESWTKMPFPESGEYIVPGALVPVQINRESDIGRYIEPNVWMHHPPE